MRPFIKKTPRAFIRVLTGVVALLALTGTAVSTAAAQQAVQESVRKNDGGLFAVLEHVHQTHPRLAAERAGLEKADAYIREQKGELLPTLSARASATSSLTEPGAFGSLNGETGDVGFELSQPLYRGGSTMARIREAEDFSEAQSERYRRVENDVLLEAVQAHIALVRDDEHVRLREKNITNLEKHLESENTRFDLGANTATDVNQAKARLAAARAEAQRARGNLAASVADYVRVSGRQPPDISGISLPQAVLADHLPSLATLETALAAAGKISPDILAAQLEESANRQAQRAIKGEYYPAVTLTGQAQRTYKPVFAPGIDYQDQSRIVLEASIPLYKGGRTTARLNQARHDGNKLRMETLDTAREVTRRVTTAWENLQAAKAEADARQVQVDAEALALDGARAEFTLGGRTSLDVLDAEQEKLDAELALLSARHDVILAEFDLLAATGQMTWDVLHTALQH
ncbi:MAG: TolC family outer membrane protein [Pseudomonadota bacterium]|nr:hypothetical protein [Pseudomonadota bacterium]QKK04204.1 MAG: TolC family outer membrane protein [Pseudomonadota bacterium]